MFEHGSWLLDRFDALHGLFATGLAEIKHEYNSTVDAIGSLLDLVGALIV